jgi:hypothetical protein
MTQTAGRQDGGVEPIDNGLRRCPLGSGRAWPKVYCSCVFVIVLPGRDAIDRTYRGDGIVQSGYGARCLSSLP